MEEYSIKGLDDYTSKMFNKLGKEYPKEVKKFMRTTVNNCKKEALSRTPKGKTGNLKKGWRTSVRAKAGNCMGSITNKAPHAHLLENGHFDKAGGWVEGVHMLENTMTNQQPKIDKSIEEFVDDMLDF